MNLLNRKWHPGLWIQTPHPIHVPLILMSLMDLMHLKSPGLGGPTFDALDPLDSDQGPTRMHLINLKSPGLGGGGDFRFIRSISCGPGSESNESNEFKVLAWGPTLESLASVYAFDAEAPDGAWWSLNLKSWGPLSMHWIQ